MTHDEALCAVRGYAEAGRIVLTRHAIQRMRSRGASELDVRHALSLAARCTEDEEPDLWRVEGPDLDNDAMTLVVAIEDGVIVVTMF